MGRGSQAPILLRKPELFGQAPLAFPSVVELVTPLNIFAAGRLSFEAIVRAHVLPAEALVLIFAALPLRVQGWESDKTKITAAGRRGGWPVWLVERI